MARSEGRPLLPPERDDEQRQLTEQQQAALRITRSKEGMQKAADYRLAGSYRLITADCLQAELVDGFLAWDFDADTASTFFAKQV